MRALILLAALGSLAACSASRDKPEGSTCVTSQECGAGLLCDFGKTPHVCAKTESIGRDMAVPAPDLSVSADLAGVDLTGADLTAVVGGDLKMPADMTPPADLANQD